MDEKLINQIYELKEMLSKDERIISLNNSEAIMNENEEVMKLAYAKDMAIEELNSIPESLKDSDIYNKAMEKLSKCKSELQNHPLVKDYLSKYIVVRDLYLDINEILFSNFQEKLCENK